MAAKECKNMPLFTDRYRYFILVLSLLCLTSISSNMLTFNFSVICMTPHENATNEHPTYNFTNTQQSALIWSVGVGSMVGTFPFSYAYSRFGARFIFLAAGLTSIFATALTPLAASLGFEWFMGMRFLQGLAYSADFAAIGMLCSRWSSLKQHAFYISVLTCYSPLSSTLTNMFSGFICESFLGWPFIYYSHAVIGSILFAAWTQLYNDFPAKNPHVSMIELEKIERGKGEEELELSSYVPYWEICTNPVVLTIWYNAFAEIASGIFLVTYTPIFLRNVFGFSVEVTGLLSSLPPLLNIPFRMSMGLFSDKIKWCSERVKINAFNTFSLLGPAICYAAVSFVPHDSRVLAVVFLVMINFFYAGSGGGFYKYSNFIVANIQFVKCITLFIAPLLYAYFVKDSSDQSQWRSIFLIITASQLLATVLFLIFSTDQPQPFTKLTGKAPKKSAIGDVSETEPAQKTK